MAFQFDGVTVGAMQYNGVTIGEAMIDGQVVYRSVPPSPYPMSGEWQSALTATATTFDSHTIEEVGEYTITHTLTGGGSYVQAYVRGPWGSTTGSVGPPSTVTISHVLAVGDLIEFRAGAISPSGTATGTWSISHRPVTVIRVTPTPPTFHDGEPWITLPTVEGVTYSVAGTPGYNASVTVAATADEGYELVGTASWSHTYGPAPSIYPMSGEWSGLPATPQVMESHTIAEAGSFTIRHEVTGHGLPFSWGAIRGPWGATSGTDADPSIATVTRTLAVGAVIDFMGGSGLTTFQVTGSWSIMKN